MVNAQEITDNTGRLGTESDRGANRANRDNKLTRRIWQGQDRLTKLAGPTKASKANQD